MYLKPRDLSLDTFSYKRYITDLTEDEYEEAKNEVLVTWAGVVELWECLSEDIKYSKRLTAINLLIMWWLADMYPTRLVGGVQSSGGMAVKSKSIRDVSISYGDLQLPESYSVLASNQFGVKAAYMISTAPEMMGVYG